MLTEEYSIPIKNKRSVRPRTIKQYTRTKGLSDQGPSKSIHEQQAYQITDPQRLYKNKRPTRTRTIKDYTRIRPQTIKGYTRTRGYQIKDHQRLYKNYQIKDHQTRKKAYQIKDHKKIIQEQTVIRPRTIKGYTRTSTLRSSLQETGLN